jgi:MFS transporter, DHA1 family, multidrug resistance protein
VDPERLLTDDGLSQRYLGRRGLVVFLGLLSAFVPLSTDLYLPALPTMTAYFRVPEYQTNLTLILFFIFFSVATLVWGPLSDRHGRRKILIIGLTGYAIASALCALSLNIYELMLFRVLQAVGGGAATAIATAIVRDVYQGRRRERILAIVQSMVIISPAVAPVVGALLLGFTSWRGIFVAQAMLGVVVVAGSVAFRETLHSRSSGHILHTLGRLGVVLKNPAFTSLLLIFSLVSVGTMPFISSSSYIYQETFHQSTRVYSYYFAFNALGYLSGPLIYLRLSARFRRASIINACFAVMALSGLLVFTLGRFAPWAFALTVLPSSVVVSGLRPASSYLMLDQQEGDAGSASALMTSCQMVMGSVGMIIASLHIAGRVQLIGLLNIVFGLLCGGLWLALTRMPVLRRAGSS